MAEKMLIIIISGEKDKTKAMENIKRLTYAFRSIDIKIHYAVKANYNPYIVSTIYLPGSMIK